MWEMEVHADLTKSFLLRKSIVKIRNLEQSLKLVAAWQQGGIGGAVLYHNLKAGERLPEAMTFEDWERDIEEHGQTATFMGLGDDDEDEQDEEDQGE